MKQNQFTPKFFTILKEGLSTNQIIKDILAGVIVGIVALPLAIAFAIASGVSPEKGLITAVIAGLTISIFGGSRVQIGGPTGAFIVIIYAIVQEHGIDGLTIATFMAGFLIIGMGWARLGGLLKFIPYPLIVGFTSGIALIIFSSQINDFFGLSIDKVPADFIEKWMLYARNSSHINWVAFGIAMATVLISFNFHRITIRIPGSIIAIILSTIVVHVFHLPVDTIETQFGSLSNHISMPSLPHADWAMVKSLIQPAFAIALLGSIESLLSAVVADGMTGGQHRSNAELVAQGMANVFSSIFGGLPATGAIARTATNIKNGGRTPIAGIVHALVLLLIMLFLMPYAKLIPLACLAGILVVVAYHMSEWKNFLSLLKGNGMDVIVLLATFFLTVVFDLVIAIEIGVVLASFLFMKRMSDSLSIEKRTDSLTKEYDNGEELFDEELPKISDHIALYEINGPLFFGAAREFQDTIRNIHQDQQILILRMRHVSFVDATGCHYLKEIIKQFDLKHVNIILSGVNNQVKKDLENAGIYTVLDKANLLENIGQSMKRAEEILKETESK